MAKAYQITHDRLLEILDYDPETGVFVWKTQPCRRLRAGERAGSLRCDGYRFIRINHKQYSEHRLAWFYVHGRWPAVCIDHVNRDPSDNRISNLREADHTQNRVNRGAPAGKMKGARFNGSGWVASIKAYGKSKYLGTFSTEEEASRAYAEAASRIFGEFAGDAA